MKYLLSIFSSKRLIWRFVGHLALFALAILCAQTIIYWAYWKDTFSLPLRNENIIHQGTPILYFGDSVLKSREKNSPESSTLPNLLQAQMPQTPIGTLQNGGYSADMYLAYGDYIVRESYHPRLCIFEINMRSFSNGWDLRPEWQFVQEKLTLSHGVLFRIFFRPLSVFKAFNLTPVTQEEFDHAPVFDGERMAGQVMDYLGPASRAMVGDMFVLDYMHVLQKDHRKVRDLITLCKMLRSHGIEPFFYITPVDYQTGDHYLGPRFEKRLGDNVEMIERELAEAGCCPLDLSRSLGPEAFDWRVVAFPNEHLNLKGRREVVKRLTCSSKQLGPF